MNTQDVETVTSKSDVALVTLAALIALAGVLGFSFLSEQTMLARVGILGGGLVLAIAIAWFSQLGKQFLAFAHESYEETRRVTWPAKKETLTTTGVVFAFVVVMAIFLFLVDKTLEWSLYDLLLGWK
jgi:preprotein translocase subunit SecE